MISQTQADKATIILAHMAELCAKVQADVDQMKRAADEWREKFTEEKD